MKKLLLISAVILMAAGCQVEPYSQDFDGDYLVYTAPAKDFDFGQFQTFDIADSVLVIGQSQKPYYSASDNALALIQSYRTNMEKRGYIYLPSNPAAELGIQLTYVVKTERFLQYYNDPYWWFDYPGYWNPGYWGNWSGWYYPQPVAYTFTTNGLITEMVDLTGDEVDGKLAIVWSNYIGGQAGSSIQSDIKRFQNSIDQAFAQSPYLKPDTSK